MGRRPEERVEDREWEEVTIGKEVECMEREEDETGRQRAEEE